MITDTTTMTTENTTATNTTRDGRGDLETITDKDKDLRLLSYDDHHISI